MMSMQQGQAIMTQPGFVPQSQYVMMPIPGPIPGVPAGLESFLAVDELICQQEVEFLEVIFDIDCKNKYRIFNSQNQQVFYVFEDSDDCHRIMCGSCRGFVLHVKDSMGQEVITIVRVFKCCSCFRQPVFVSDRSGRRLGFVKEMESICPYQFGIFDENEQFLYEIRAPCCPCQTMCAREDINFPVCNTYGQVGNLRKIWAGFVQEKRTNADNFGVSCNSVYHYIDFSA